MKDYPHDEFFKYLFSIVEAVRVFLEEFLPAHVLELLDLDSLQPDDTEYITPDLAAIYSDKVYRCLLKKIGEKPLMAAIALLEHKSFKPDYPHFQLIEYRQRIWNLFLQNGEKPVFVLPVILYHPDSYREQNLDKKSHDCLFQKPAGSIEAIHWRF